MKIVKIAAVAAIVAALTTANTSSAGAAGGDTRVSVGSSASPFSQNKQNEPAVAVDANHPDVMVAGSNDNIDMEACNSGDDTTCPFTGGVGVSGVYISQDKGSSWTQPTYTGNSARSCVGEVGDDAGCTPKTGPIGTLPNYAERGLVSDGDPAVSFGPVYSGGKFSWDNGSRLYYANLTSNMPGQKAFKGSEAIAVSSTDDISGAKSGQNSAWSQPVIASKQNSSLFSDKEQVWADNAASSPHFGNVYVCYAPFQGSKSSGHPGQALDVITSTDGGQHWTDRQVTPAADNPKGKQGFGRSGCTVRTDSKGNVYVFDTTFSGNTSGSNEVALQMIKSTNGGATFGRPKTVFTTHDVCGHFEPSIGRCVEDGVAGARDDLAQAPSVDIANGAPTGGDATDRIVMSWVDGGTPGAEKVQFSTSTDGGSSWSSPVAVQDTGDRGYYTAPSISPDGTDVYLTYNAFTTPFRDSAEGASNDRQLVGVVKHADVSGGSVGQFSTLHRAASGDARASSQNDVAAEFLGDYVYSAATRDYGTAVWNDMRGGVDCPAVDSYRQGLHEKAVATGEQTAEAEEPRGEQQADKGHDAEDEDTAPAPQQDCPAGFGNSDIYGGTYADPTP